MSELLSGKQSRLADDLLRGAKMISEHVFGSEGETRKVYHLASTGVLPVFYLGDILCARKSTLLNWIVDQEAKASASHSSRAA